MFFIYQLILTFIVILSPVIIFLRVIKNKEDKKRFIEKYSLPSKKRTTASTMSTLELKFQDGSGSIMWKALKGIPFTSPLSATSILEKTLTFSVVREKKTMHHGSTGSYLVP